MPKFSTSRRDFLGKAAQGTAAAALGGGFWAYLLNQQAHASPYAIRPPGAVPEADFNATCIKCGKCVDACPYDTLRLATLGESVPIGTPHYAPRDVPCYMCVDIPCKVACPTGALDQGLTDINKARMGLAVIDIEHCLSWNGLRCEICYRECPVQGKAITVEQRQRALSKHAMFVPIVHSDHCTGCGVCEKACPTEEASIRVLPPHLVQGKVQEHYRFGWKSETGITQEFHPHEGAAPAMPPAKKSEKAPGMDYLNLGDEP